MQLPYESPKDVADQRQVVASCVERWAARLAAAPDSASDVANGVVTGACGTAIEYLQRMEESENPDGVSPLDAKRAYYYGRALFITIQTRAGNCYPDA